MLNEPFSSRHRMFWSRVVVAILVACMLLFGRPPAFIAPWVLDLGELAGLILLASAAFGRIWCLVFVAGKKEQILVTAGPYSIVRNPLYVFSFLGAVGFGLAVENPPLALLLAVLFGAYYTFVVRREERCLASMFGSAFQEYVARTPRWLPNFSLYSEPDSVTVSPMKIRRGILDAMWFIWAFFAWELIEEFHYVALLAPGM